MVDVGIASDLTIRQVPSPAPQNSSCQSTIRYFRGSTNLFRIDDAHLLSSE